jgi:PAS domain S-box-containing protein
LVHIFVFDSKAFYDAHWDTAHLIVFLSYFFPIFGVWGETIKLHKSAQVQVIELEKEMTERKRAEEELRESEEKYRNILENIEDGYFEVDLTGNFTFFNPSLCRILGYPGEEMPGMNNRVFMDAENAKKVFRAFNEVYVTGIPRRGFEWETIRKDGGRTHIEVSVSLIAGPGEKPTGFRGIARDVTERKQVEEVQMRLVAMLDATPGFVGYADAKDTHILYINSAGRKMVGVQAQEDVTRLKIADVHPEWTNKLFRDEINPTAIRDGLWTGECAFLNRDGHEIPVMMALLAHKSPSGEVERFSTVSIDITDRKRAEEKVHASHEQMRALAGRLQAVREEERTNIAREIHDELGGALTGMKVDVSFLIKSALKIENEAARTSLLAGMDSVTKAIDTTIHAVRRIAMELRPGILDDLGLIAALEWQLKDFEKRTGIRCELFPPAEDIGLDADLSTALFRIFQEALTNVVRHSGATEVRVRLCTEADSSTLEVEDNGKGIEKEKILSSKSLGLLGMRERAQMFGGRITVTGTPGTGTIVTVEVPPSYYDEK